MLTMAHHKKDSPPNPWTDLVARSIHDPETIEWLDSNIENILRGCIHQIGYYGNIDHLFPPPTVDNQWLYDEDTNSCTGYFITRYSGLYGSWSNEYAYRSHFFQIFCSGDRPSHYSAGDPPQFLIDDFAKQGKEIVLWEQALSKDHPLLQKAKAESLALGMNKAIATRLWNKATPDTFWQAWENRKSKD
jgi:hypothetical protein